MKLETGGLELAVSDMKVTVLGTWGDEPESETGRVRQGAESIS